MLEESLKSFLSDNVWLFFVGFLGFLFKNTIEKLAASFFVFIGNDYNEDDIVLVNGRPGRIVRVGWTKTVFFLYEIKDDKVTGGTKLVVQNERLSSLNIEKPLDKLDVP